MADFAEIFYLLSDVTYTKETLSFVSHPTFFFGGGGGGATKL